MEDYILKFWPQIVAACGAFGGLVKWLRRKFRESDKRQDAVEKGIQALLRDRLVQAYYHYSERGWITLHGLEACEKMYMEYHNLGGNGAVTKLIEDLRELPVRERSNEDERQAE